MRPALGDSGAPKQRKLVIRKAQNATKEKIVYLCGKNENVIIYKNHKEDLLYSAHCDLYDGGENRGKIPFDKIKSFIGNNI